MQLDKLVLSLLPSMVETAAAYAVLRLITCGRYLRHQVSGAVGDALEQGRWAENAYPAGLINFPKCLAAVTR